MYVRTKFYNQQDLSKDYTLGWNKLDSERRFLSILLIQPTLNAETSFFSSKKSRISPHTQNTFSFFAKLSFTKDVLKNASFKTI